MKNLDKLIEENKDIIDVLVKHGCIQRLIDKPYMFISNLPKLIDAIKEIRNEQGIKED